MRCHSINTALPKTRCRWLSEPNRTPDATLPRYGTPSCHNDPGAFDTIIAASRI